MVYEGSPKMGVVSSIYRHYQASDAYALVYSVSGFNRQSSERKWLKRAKGTRRSQRKPKRLILDLVRMHPRASAYTPIALGGMPEVDLGANAYAPEAPNSKLDSEWGPARRKPGVAHLDDLSCRSLRATDGRNGVNFDVVNATPLPAAWGP
ncbi:hypothetical protein PIB30_018510 [Stylosanthes scabra]|uniref:Uncharacterized protein n=1 Tax=Stylosanthes scabra TaxID=79078 RepID=A0ABU6X7Z9_9FABA|nr:hypothetical protein [Stylosanthes scabra]